MKRQQISFDINCKHVSVSPNGNNSVTVTIEDCDNDELLDITIDLISSADLIDSLDESEILDHIVVDKVKKYFELTEIE